MRSLWLLWLLWLLMFCTLLAGGGFGLLLLRADTDMVLIAVGPHRLQISFLLFLLLLFLLFGLVLTALRWGFFLRRWSGVRAEKKAELALQQGIAYWLSGRNQLASKSLLAYVGSSSRPLAGYFALARLAEREGELLRGAGQIAQGRERHRELDQLLAMEQAYLLLLAGEAERASAVIHTLPADVSFATELRARLALQTGNLDGAAELATQLSKQGSGLEEDLLTAGLAAATDLAEVKKMVKVRSRLQGDRLESGLAEVEARTRLGDLGKATSRLEMLVEAHLEKEPDGVMEKYLEITRQMKLRNSQIASRLDKWHRAHAGCWSVPYAQAQLHLEAGALDKAEERLKVSLELRPTRQGLLALGDLLRDRGRQEEAADCYRRALFLNASRDRLLPVAGVGRE